MKRPSVRRARARSALLPALALLLGATAPVMPAASAADAPCDQQSASRSKNPCGPANPCAPARKNCASGKSKPPANPCAPARPARPANPCAPAAGKKS